MNPQKTPLLICYRADDPRSLLLAGVVRQCCDCGCDVRASQASAERAERFVCMACWNKRAAGKRIMVQTMNAAQLAEIAEYFRRRRRADAERN